MHTRFKLPYQIFPGIFSSIDSYSKKITGLFFEEYRKLPEWFNGFNLSKPIKTPSLSEFNTVDPETNIKVTGVLDELFLRNDRSYLIADYKTAKYTKHQDELLPMYEVQLNGYAHIAEHIGFNPVTGLVLIYYEPVTDISSSAIETLVDLKTFILRFSAHVLEIKRKPELLPTLLEKARNIYDMPIPPDSREGCKDCRLINNLIKKISIPAHSI